VTRRAPISNDSGWGTRGTRDRVGVSSHGMCEMTTPVVTASSTYIGSFFQFVVLCVVSIPARQRGLMMAMTTPRFPTTMAQHNTTSWNLFMTTGMNCDSQQVLAFSFLRK
jgi:hypothetical protein